ncbi:maleylpyruvate isomerase N-terminal domain-containing protein [Nocardioides sp. InS609-2]|uniref:maleylpyruvate isomerase N-terminal domain-containing protein n=1 Tax=Nocardioides sp. InS609-2 TaxID=2760705 RepID=UPI0020BFCA72|nr:maleylpyruvate isomerase N-terminal domain-containing protein [Nocardioides sp. InS609-2]
MDTNSLGEHTPMWRGAFLEAADWFADSCQRAADSLDAPGLGDWSVRDLMGHTSRALSTVESYLTDDTTEPVGVVSSVGYFATALRTDPLQIALRGREAGAALGAEPAATVTELVTRVRERVVAATGLARVRTPFGTMVLAEYLPTRTFELVVHTGDLLRAVGEAAVGPELGTRSALRLATDLGQHHGHGPALLAYLTGRRAGIAGPFTVLEARRAEDVLT